MFSTNLISTPSRIPMYNEKVNLSQGLSLHATNFFQTDQNNGRIAMVTHDVIDMLHINDGAGAS